MKSRIMALVCMFASLSSAVAAENESTRYLDPSIIAEKIKAQPMQTVADVINQALSSGPGIVVLGQGTYRVNAPLMMSMSGVTLRANHAVLQISHTGIALDISPDTGVIRDINIEGDLQLMAKFGSGDAVSNKSSIGIRLRNVYQSQFRGFSISGFHTGMQLLGDGKGTVYNLIEPRLMAGNFYQMAIQSAHEGWTNQNTVMGGRWQAATAFPGGAHIRIDAITLDPGSPNYPNNGNSFLHLSLEGQDASPDPAHPGPEHYRAVVCNGIYNSFYDTRTEGTLGFYFGPSSAHNTVMLGTYISASNIHDDSKKNRSILQGADGLIISGGVSVVGDLKLRKPASGMLLRSPAGKCFKMTVGNDGALKSAPSDCY